MEQLRQPPLPPPPFHELQRVMEQEARAADHGAGSRAAAPRNAGEVAGPMQARNAVPLLASSSWQEPPSSDLRPSSFVMGEPTEDDASTRRSPTRRTTACFGWSTSSPIIEGSSSPNREADELFHEASHHRSSSSTSPVDAGEAASTPGAGAPASSFIGQLRCAGDALEACAPASPPAGCARGFTSAECAEVAEEVHEEEESTGDFTDVLAPFADDDTSSDNTHFQSMVAESGGARSAASAEESAERLEAVASHTMLRLDVESLADAQPLQQETRLADSVAHEMPAEITGDVSDAATMAQLLRHHIEAAAEVNLPELQAEMLHAGAQQMLRLNTEIVAQDAALHETPDDARESCEKAAAEDAAVHEPPDADGQSLAKDAAAHEALATERQSLAETCSLQVQREDRQEHAAEAASLHESSRKPSTASVDQDANVRDKQEMKPEAQNVRGYPVRIALSGGEAMRAHLWATEEDVLRLNPVRGSALKDIQTRLDEISREQAAMAEKIQELMRDTNRPDAAVDLCRDLQQQMEAHAKVVRCLQSSMGPCLSGDLQQQLQSHSKALGVLETSRAEDLQATNQRLESSCSAINALQSSLGDLKKSKAQVEADMESNTSAIIALQLSSKDLKQSKASVEDLQSTKHNLQSNSQAIGALQSLMDEFKHSKAQAEDLQVTKQNLQNNSQAIAAIQSSLAELQRSKAQAEDLQGMKQHVDNNSKGIAALQSSLVHWLENLQATKAQVEDLQAPKQHLKSNSQAIASLQAPMADLQLLKAAEALPASSPATLASEAADGEVGETRVAESSLTPQRSRSDQLAEEQQTHCEVSEASGAARSHRVAQEEFEEEWRWELRKQDSETSKRLREATDEQSALLAKSREEIEVAMAEMFQEREKDIGRVIREASDSQSALLTKSLEDIEVTMTTMRKEIETTMEGHITQVLSVLMADRASVSAESQGQESLRKTLLCDVEARISALSAECVTSSARQDEDEVQALLGDLSLQVAKLQENRLAERGFRAEVSLELHRLSAQVNSQAAVVEEALRRPAEDPAAAFQLEVDRAVFESELQDGRRRMDDAVQRLQSEVCSALQLTQKAAQEHRDQSEAQEALHESFRRQASDGDKAQKELQEVISRHGAELSEIHNLVEAHDHHKEEGNCKLAHHNKAQELLEESLGEHQAELRCIRELVAARELAEHDGNCKAARLSEAQDALNSNLGVHQQEMSELCQLVASLRGAEQEMASQLASHSANHQVLHEKLHGHQHSVAELQQEISCQLASHSEIHQVLHETVHDHQMSIGEFQKLVTTQKLDDVSGRFDDSHATLMLSLESECSQLDDKVRRAVADSVSAHAVEHSRDYEATVRAELERALEPTLEQAVAHGIAAHAAANAKERAAEHSRECEAVRAELERALEPALQVAVADGIASHAAATAPQRAAEYSRECEAAVRAELERVLEQAVADGIAAHASAHAPQRKAELAKALEEALAFSAGSGAAEASNKGIPKQIVGQRPGSKQSSKGSVDWHQSAASGEHYSDDSFEEDQDEGDSQRRHLSSGSLCLSTSSPVQRRPKKRGSEEDESAWVLEANHLRTQQEKLRQQVLHTSDEQREEISELRAQFAGTLQRLHETASSTAHFGRDEATGSCEIVDVAQPSRGSQHHRDAGAASSSSVEDAGLCHAVGLQVKAELQEALQVQKAVFQKFNRRLGKALSGQLNDALKDSARPSSNAGTSDGAVTVADELGRARGAASSGDSAAIATAAEEAAALRAANDAANCRELVFEMRRALLEQHEESTEVCRYAEDAMAAARAETAAMMASRIVAPVPADSSASSGGGLRGWISHANPAAASRAWEASEDTYSAAPGADLADEVRGCFADVPQQRPRAARMARMPSPMAPGLSAAQAVSNGGGMSSSGGEVTVPSLQNLGPRGSGAGTPLQFPSRPRTLAASQSEPSLAAGSSTDAAGGAASGACRSGEIADTHSGQSPAGQTTNISQANTPGGSIGIGARGRAAWVPAGAPRALSSSSVRHSAKFQRMERALRCAKAVEMEERRGITSSANIGGGCGVTGVPAPAAARR